MDSKHWRAQYTSDDSLITDNNLRISDKEVTLEYTYSDGGKTTFSTPTEDYSRRYQEHVGYQSGEQKTRSR